MSFGLYREKERERKKETFALLTFFYVARLCLSGCLGLFYFLGSQFHVLLGLITGLAVSRLPGPGLELGPLRFVGCKDDLCTT